MKMWLIMVNRSLFHISKCSDKLFGNIVYKKETEMNSLIQVLASHVFAAMSEFWLNEPIKTNKLIK